VPIVGPFRALRFDPAVVGSLEAVTAPPYDVISDDRRRELLAASPWSVVGLDLADGSADPGRPDSRYRRASASLERWIADGALILDPEPAFWAYEMSGPAGPIRGVVCAMELHELGTLVVPHERTMPGPVRDRLDLLRALGTHLSPVYGVIEGPVEPLDALLGRIADRRPEMEVVDRDGVRHRAWPIAKDAPIDRWLAEETMLIADGHHRYETARRYRDELRGSLGPGPWDRVLVLIVDAGRQDLPVLPFHRVQSAGEVPPGGEEVADPIAALAALSDRDVAVVVVEGPDGRGRARVLRPPGTPPTVRALHAAYLDHLGPDAIAYTPDPERAIATVRAGEAAAAYLLPPTGTATIRRVVERGERLPPKSTYFWPKPRTGLLMMPIDGRYPAPETPPRPERSLTEGPRTRAS
jgi:uncharacterized protein (DUF1015 family)